MDNAQKIRALTSIINNGSCAITPPIMGWLIEAQVITPEGFDVERAKGLLREAKASQDDTPPAG